jgi:hypothetical protein
VPARVSSAVLSAWNPAVISRRLVAAAAVTLVIAGLAGLAISATLLPGVFIALAGTATSALAAVYGPPLAVIGVAGSLLFDNPAWLAVFAVITGLVCLLWIRLFTGLQFRREVIQ